MLYPFLKVRKLCEKFNFRIRKSSTKFHIKVKKPHFKLRKALFKKGLERNFKIKNVLEFDLEKEDNRIIFEKEKKFKKIIVLKA